MVTSYLKRVSNKGRNERKKHDNSSYNAMSFNYNNITISTAYTSVPVGKAPYFNGSNYN
jgi:hypothetical protein